MSVYDNDTSENCADLNSIIPGNRENEIEIYYLDKITKREKLVKRYKA